MLVSLICCILLLLMFNALASPGELKPGVVLALIVLPISVLLISPTIALQTILLCISAGIAKRFSLRRWGLAVTSSLATAVAYSSVGYFFFQEEITEWNIVREENPLESLSSRLAYENASLRKPAGLSAAQLDKQSLALQRLEAIEQGLKDGVKIVLRERSLEMAHAGFVKQFANTPGFGAARQIFRPSPSVTRLTEDRRFPVPLMKTYLDLDSSKPDYPTPPGVAAIPSSREDSAWRLHRDGLLHFLYPEGFGYIRDRDHIAGFRPHQFRTYPQSWPFSWEPKPQKETWLLTQLELVSLLKYDKPAVYVSDSLPSMADIGQYETRSLDAFEASALPLLQAGEDLTKELKDKNLSILGSIRATKQCLKCHDAKRGDLLGAFTYKLRREPAPR